MPADTAQETPTRASERPECGVPSANLYVDGYGKVGKIPRRECDAMVMNIEASGSLVLAKVHKTRKTKLVRRKVFRGNSEVGSAFVVVLHYDPWTGLVWGVETNDIATLRIIASNGSAIRSPQHTVFVDEAMSMKQDFMLVGAFSPQDDKIAIAPFRFQLGHNHGLNKAQRDEYRKRLGGEVWVSLQRLFGRAHYVCCPSGFLCAARQGMHTDGVSVSLERVRAPLDGTLRNAQRQGTYWRALLDEADKSGQRPVLALSGVTDKPRPTKKAIMRNMVWVPSC